MIKTVLDRTQDTGNLLVDLNQIALGLVASRMRIGLCRIPGLAIFFDKGRDQFRVQQPFLQPIQNPRLDVSACDGRPVGANSLALVANARAAIPGLVDQRVT